LLEQLVALARTILAVRSLFFRLRDRLVVDGRAALRLYVRDYLRHFVLVEVRAVYAQKARRSRRQEEHIAATQELLRAVRVNDRARVNLLRDSEGYARGEVRFDEAGDNV